MATPPTTESRAKKSVTAVNHPDPVTMAGRRNQVAGTKLASSIAGKIVSDLSAAGWPEGTVFGSETELLQRYGVSRAVFREAVRLLEHQQVVRMRRGPGGGLVVGTTSIQSVTDAFMVYLVYIQATLAEVYEARLAVEEAAAELASQRLSEEGIVRLREQARQELAGEVTDHRQLHALTAHLTGNPALEFFVDLLNRVTLLYHPEKSRMFTAPVLSASADAHSKIIDSIVSGNATRARDRMRKHLQAEADFLGRRLPARPQLDTVFAASPEGAKLGESVARLMFAEVSAGGWHVGAALGSEADLMERFEVSRAVLREAVRVLEHHQIARMRRGPGGGLFVTEPGANAATVAVAMHLDRGGIEPADLFEVRGILEMIVLDKVIDKMDDSIVARLQDVLEVERGASRSEFPVVGHDLHTVLADLSGNRVLALLTDVLVHLTRSHGAVPSDALDPLPTEAVIHTHNAIVDAILARDGDLARHRMRRHLSALIRWVG
ncbi:MAG: nanR 1 [Acidimicrobiales bacterium]|nr:nanR 1 [Acidimicrobiales bacterium]